MYAPNKFKTKGLHMSGYALILTGYGTNCHTECAHVAKEAGAKKADIVHFSDLVSAKVSLDDYNWLIFPGGFLDGDDLGAAQAAAQRWRHLKDINGKPLLESLQTFIENGKLILGICNGFQLLVKLGVLPSLDDKLFERQVSLAHNGSARYEDRWVDLKVNAQSPCVFTKGLDNLTMPVRHGEGRIVAKDEQTLNELVKQNLIALSYANPSTNEITQEYPYNPNNSPLGIAGLTNKSGRVLGLMPHPEAYNHKTNHPEWTRGKTSTLGTALFVNAVEYLNKNF